MNILLLDIETAPNTAYVWGLFKETIPLARLVDSSYVLCWSAKWYGSEDTFFSSVNRFGPEVMLEGIHGLLEKADMVVHFNGKKFDIPTLNREFIKYGMKPPSPYKQVDLYTVAKSNFRFVSYKMDYICQELKLGEKKETNFKLWVDCMNNDPEAWAKMEEYNHHDVILLERLYDAFLPWIKSHPNHNVHNFAGVPVCTNCGGHDLQRRGFSFTRLGKFQRYQCQDCGTWMRIGTSELDRNDLSITMRQA